MAITKDTGRQWPLVAIAEIAFGDTPTTATFYEAIDVPGTARIIGGALTVTEAWDSTTNTFAVEDATTSARYLAATDLKALGTTVFDFTLEGGLAVEDIGVLYTETGAATTVGAATLFVTYVLDGKSNEVQPTQD